MKRIIFFTFCLSLLYSCKQEKLSVSDNAEQLKAEVNAAETALRLPKEEYQTWSPQIKFVTDTDKRSMDVEGQKIFIQSSSLPLDPEFSTWSTTHAPSDAVSLYKEFVLKQKSHIYLNVFRQYEAWLLLTHYNMLSSSSNKSIKPDDSKYLVSQLIEAKYKGYQLLAYSLKYLEIHKLTTVKELDLYAKQIVDNVNTTNSTAASKPLTESDIKTNGKPLPPGAMEMINKYRDQQASQNVYLEQIRGYIVSK